jgi:hypothetical protein
MTMRPSPFGRFDRQAVYYREPPARRLAVILSVIFLLSLSSVATLTSVRSKGVEQDSSGVSMIARPSGIAR